MLMAQIKPHSYHNGINCNESLEKLDFDRAYVSSSISKWKHTVENILRITSDKKLLSK